MAEETVAAESSAAAAAVETPKFTQFDAWDQDGNPVVAKKESPKPAVADSAAADTSKETKTPKTGTDDAADSAAKKTQEQAKSRKPWQDANRWKELTDRTKQLEKDLVEARKPKTDGKADSSTARTEQKPAQPEATRPKPTMADKGADGNPKYKSYEDYNEDLVDWKVEQKVAARERDQQATQQSETLNKQLTEARGRYADFDSVTKPLIQEMLKPDIPREVFAVINDSPVLADLLYTLGGTEATKTDFLEACRTNPGKALRVALLVEQDIAKELGKGKTAAGKKDGGEGEAETTPAVVKPRAPKPPAEVGGRGAPGEDALISAAKAGDFRTFDAEQTRRAVASRR